MTTDPATALLDSQSGVGGVYRMEIDFQITGTLKPGASFGAVVFNVGTLSAGLARVSGDVGAIRANYCANWPAFNGYYDMYNNPVTNFWMTDADLGSNATDWQALTVNVDPANVDLLYTAQDQNGFQYPQSDPRMDIGVDSPFMLGTIDVSWGGLTTRNLSLTNASWQTVTEGVVDTGKSMSTTTFTFVSSPEPASLGLLAMGGMMLLMRRKQAVGYPGIKKLL